MTLPNSTKAKMAGLATLVCGLSASPIAAYKAAKHTSDAMEHYGENYGFQYFKELEQGHKEFADKVSSEERKAQELSTAKEYQGLANESFKEASIDVGFAAGYMLTATLPLVFLVRKWRKYRALAAEEK